MMFVVAVAAIVGAGFAAAVIDRALQWRISWLGLVAGGLWSGWPRTGAEAEVYKAFIVGTVVILALLVYAAVHVVWGRRNQGRETGGSGA